MKIVLGEPEKFRLKWCGWATAARLLCAYQSILEEHDVVYGVTRLVAVNADGGDMLVLLQDSNDVQGQFEDRVIDWHPGPDNTVLIEADEGIAIDNSNAVSSGAAIYGRVGSYGAPAVFALNVLTGRLKPVQRSRPPIRSWITDKHGEVRLGWGFAGTTESYYARLEGDNKWQRLAKFEEFSRENHYTPVAIDTASLNKAYALGPADGRQALWLVDLTDVELPKLLFSNPKVDVSGPIIGIHGNLLGVRYETEFPQIEYIDPSARVAAEAVRKAVPGQFVAIVDSSENERIYVVACWSDVDPLSYRVFNVDYYSLAHLARFVRPGARRIASGSDLGGLHSVAYRNSDDGSIALLVYNGAEVARRFTVTSGQRRFAYPLPAGSVATFWWRPTAQESEASRLGQGRVHE
jgi:hypothetical protein